MDVGFCRKLREQKVKEYRKFFCFKNQEVYSIIFFWIVKLQERINIINRKKYLCMDVEGGYEKNINL